MGALIAVAASASVAASSVPDSGVMTSADPMHRVALIFVCSSLLFYGWAGFEIYRSLR